MTYDLAHYLKEGADKLKNVPLAFASNGSDYRYDSFYWKVQGRSHWGGDILVARDEIKPADAVWMIFQLPSLWQFDCSQFCQVVNYYAWLRVLGWAADPHNFNWPDAKQRFNERIRQSGKRLKIQPFMGSVFTARRHYYRREIRAEPMKYRANGNMPAQETCMKAWEIVAAAPIGSRVNFTNDAARDSDWQYENTVKVSRNTFLAHGFGVGAKKDYPAKELIRTIYVKGTGRTGADFAEADRYVWIKEVEYFLDVPHPIACRSQR